jgi:hypothetical protein
MAYEGDGFGADSGFGMSDIFGPFSNFDPAMGRIMAQNPEALIPHLAAAGVPIPPQQEPQPSFQDRFGAADPSSRPPSATPFIPSSGSLGGESPYAQPATGFAPEAPPSGPDPGYGKLGQQIWDRFGPNSPMTAPPTMPPLTGAEGTAYNPSLSGKTQDRVEPSGPGRVPPTALHDMTGVTTGPNQAPLVAPSAQAEEDNRVANEPYTPSPRLASVEGGGSTATPTSDPRKAAATEDSKKDDTMKRALGAFSGVKAPPAPAQPQVRPFMERPPSFPTSSPIIAALSEMMSGKPSPSLNALRLLAATGGK